jgi:hypothetical protein
METSPASKKPQNPGPAPVVSQIPFDRDPGDPNNFAGYAGQSRYWLDVATATIQQARTACTAILQLDNITRRDDVTTDDLRQLYTLGMSVRNTIAHAGVCIMEEAQRLNAELTQQREAAKLREAGGN